MGSILTRNGRYTASIRIKKNGKIVHSEARTFGSKREATAWMKRREVELETHDFEKEDPPLSDVIKQYIRENEKKIGRTKTGCLNTIAASDLGKMKCSAVNSVAIATWAKALEVKPQTRDNYFSHLSAVATVAKPMWGYPLDRDEVAAARVVLRKTGVTSRSRERTRRPTADELDRIIEYFDLAKNRNQIIPMKELIIFSLFSARRQEETCTIKWADFDRDRVLVRDMKHPGQKIGNDTICDLPPEAVAVIERQPRAADEIFPYNHKSVSAAFTRATTFLQIDNLHFHDLRHEGASRLFEMGWTIPRVAAVTGHRSWNSLKRYSHLRQVGDKWLSWKHNPLTVAQPA